MNFIPALPLRRVDKPSHWINFIFQGLLSLATEQEEESQPPHLAYNSFEKRLETFHLGHKFQLGLGDKLMEKKYLQSQFVRGIKPMRGNTLVHRRVI